MLTGVIFHRRGIDGHFSFQQEAVVSAQVKQCNHANVGNKIIKVKLALAHCSVHFILFVFFIGL